MSNLVIKPVVSRADQKQFLLLPWSLYEGDPNWIPPLLAHQRETLNFKHHPFYGEGEAEIQCFLAYDGAKCVGRVAAILNRAHNRKHNEQRGFWGFFESIDDQRVARALFDSVRAWFRERGISKLRGPANPSMNYECGLLIEGFDSQPFFMMSYNRPYYAHLIEACGFHKTQDMYAFWGHMDMLGTLDKKLGVIARAAEERFGVTLRPMNRKKFREEVETFLHIYNESLMSTWGFVPLSRGEIKFIGSGLQHLIVPELCVVAEAEGKPVGAVFALLNYNPRIKAINGRLWPFGFLKLLGKKRSIKSMRLISTNVIPEYQRWGVGLVLMRALVPRVKDWGINDAEFSWVLESNDLSRGSLQKGGAKLTKTYRMYDDDPAPLTAAS